MAVFQEPAQGLGHLVAQAQVLLHEIAPQIEIAVGQAHLLGKPFFVELERQRLGAVEDFNAVGDDFHLAGAQMRIFRAGRPRAYAALDAQDEFGTHRFGYGERFFFRGVEHGLHHALAVAQVDENHAAVVAPAVGPAAQGDAFPDEGFVEFAAKMTAHDYLFLVYEKRNALRRPGARADR